MRFNEELLGRGRGRVRCVNRPLNNGRASIAPGAQFRIDVRPFTADRPDQPLNEGHIRRQKRQAYREHNEAERKWRWRHDKPADDEHAAEYLMENRQHADVDTPDDVGKPADVSRMRDVLNIGTL